MTNTIDAELTAVLIALTPLGPRGLRYVDLERREFSWETMLEAEGWSTGEAQLIRVAGALWNDAPVDLCYIASALGEEFFQAVIDAVAARRGRDFHTNWIKAMANAT